MRSKKSPTIGSSPRGRGKPSISVFWVPLYGLIPARAGKTYPRNSGHRRSRAHPRAGGENKLAMNVSHSSQGSSPRGRGKPRPRGWGKSPFRLIPPRAGKTRGAVNDALAPAAHPRAGGENLTPAGRLVIDSGSSPRGRGKHRAGARVREHPGLIPARAGKTSIGRATSRVLPGSSPRGRGKHFLTCAFIERIGQILETLELAVSSGSYSVWVACATDAPQDQVRSIGLVLPSSRGAS